MEHQQDVHQAWKSECPPLSRAAQTWVGCLLIGLALFCAVQGYLAVERQRGLIPEVVSIFVEDGTTEIVLRAQTPQQYAAMLRQLRKWRAPPHYWRAVEGIGYLAWLVAGLAAWQGFRFLRAAWPRTWEALNRRINPPPEEPPPPRRPSSGYTLY
ncbi:MAG: hypothetical protein HY613_00870 [Candidatus Rokubacteria bacterium]|nr:hypothetical protein [Candidatus Rokubacteria bacterium]